MDLWHFTCDHGYAGIGRRGLLMPHAHPLMPELGPVVWLTTDPAPARDDIGLTSTMLGCDRMGYRYRAHPDVNAAPWTSLRHLVDPSLIVDLELYGKPDTWHLATDPVPVRLS